MMRIHKKKKAPKKELVAAEKLFQGLLSRLGYDSRRYAVFEVWDRILGPQAAQAQAVGLKGDRLCVEVDSSARMHDLMLRKAQILKKLNGHFGTPAVISDIIVQLAPGRRSREEP